MDAGPTLRLSCDLGEVRHLGCHAFNSGQGPSGVLLSVSGGSLGLIPWIGAIRKNHGLEHATVSLLLERGVTPPLGGYSVPGGFIVWGKTSPGVVTDAARDALLLLEDGHSDLAVSAYCGTNLVVTVVLGGVAAYLAGRGRGLGPILRGATVGILVAKILGQPVGKLIQRKVTVESDPAGMAIKSVRVLRRSSVCVVWISTANSKPGQFTTQLR